MIGSPRPPMKSKKGIQVLQSTQNKKTNHDNLDSGMGSSQSISRSRGISISRENGINIDKIYEQKHFLPSKNTQIPTSNNSSNATKTISTVKSLKVISLLADSHANNEIETKQIFPPQSEKFLISEFDVKPKGQHKIENRCNSPILKLQGVTGNEYEEGRKRETGRPKQMKL